jgi:cysteine desulfurase
LYCGYQNAIIFYNHKVAVLCWTLLDERFYNRLMKPSVYLDYNATAPMREDVLTLMTHIMRDVGNASSIHSYGRHARKIIEDARRTLANLLAVAPAQVIFNSGATEGNNAILKLFSDQRILVAASEHLSVLDAAPQAERIPVLTTGLIDMDAYKNLLLQKPAPKLVSIMYVNNETGVIQDLPTLAGLAHEAGAYFHVDAVQALGRLAFTREQIGADYITVSAHKIGGPQGVGAIIVAPKVPAPKLLLGGGQERRQRAGTENVSGIAGFAKACELASDDRTAFQNLALYRDQLQKEILKLEPEAIIFGEAAPRVANTLCCALPAISSETLLMGLDLDGIAISSGSACSSGSIRPSHVLRAMGVDEKLASCGVRISMGWGTTQGDMDRLILSLEKIIARLHNKNHSSPNFGQN